MKRSSFPKTARSGQTGFSLIELLVVVLIFGVLLAIATPNFIGQRPRQELKRLTREIVSDMQFAKVSALRNSSTWAIQFDPEDSEYKVIRDNGVDETWDTADDDLFKTVRLSNFPGAVFSLPSGYTGVVGEPDPGDGISFADNRVLFKSDGTSAGGTVYISNGNKDAFAVGSTSAAGRIKTWFNYGSGWQD